MSAYTNFYVQPFKWDETVEVADDDRRQIIHIWAKAIPVDGDGNQVCKEGSQTYLFRVLKYPSRVTIIFPDTITNKVSEKEFEVTERHIREVMTYLEGWYTTMNGMRAIDRNKVMEMKGHPTEDIKQYFKDEYETTHKVIRFTYERRRKIYYYKRAELNSQLEKETWVLNIDLANGSVARDFLSFLRTGDYVNGKRTENFTKMISNNVYKFMQGFPGISAVQRLITDRKVSRCGWFYIRDAKPAKPAERICPNTPIVKEWRTEMGEPLTITAFTPEYFVSPDSITPLPSEIARRLISRPSIMSWDIECYSDNSKAMPVPWNELHVAYIITCVYQQYKLPNTRIRKAFVFAKCDTETPTEGDGVTNSVVICRSEMDMIRKFSEFVRETDSDILIGYNIFGFDVKYLHIRMEIQNQFWENMGRLKVNNTFTGSIDWASSAYGKNELSWIDMSGRMCHDMMKTIERDYKFSDYKLETVSQALLGKGKNDVSAQEMFKIFESEDPREMLKVVMYALQDSVLPIELFEKINGWAFMTESANVMCVNPMDLFIRGQQIRLMNQFYDKCYPLMFVTHKRDVNIVPVEGAYVVDPIRGLWENVMTLDFASLYPSIMIAHNIGHDTLVLDPNIPDEHCHVFEWTDEDETTLNKEGLFVPDPDKPEDEDYKKSDEEGGQKDSGYKICKNADGKWRFRFIKEEYGHRSVAATMLVDLLAERKRVRKEQKTVKDSDPVYYDILEQRQKAIKVSCNSVYGMTLAQATGKLPLAEGGMCVTFRGRQLNLEMQKLAREKYGAVTVYGDSVTGDTPVLVRDPVNGMRYENIEDLGLDWEDGYHGAKEFSSVTRGLEVWSDSGFTKVENLIRHKCNKKIFRIVTDSGCVDVTEDHSLLDLNSEMVNPKDLSIGSDLLHSVLPMTQRTGLKAPPQAIVTGKKNAAEYFWTVCEQSMGDYRISMEGDKFVFTREDLKYDSISVREIIDLGYTDDYVYDFTTANHHFAAGVGRLVVHNTDSIMVKTAYTKLMVEAAHKFPSEKPSLDEINQLASEMGIADYSSETAMRFLEHYHGFKEEHEVCNEMGEHIARQISDHLPKPISLEFENVFVKALFLLKKRYACVTLDRDTMVIKNDPNKIYAKGIMLARRDNCKWARDTFRDVLFNILQQKPRNEISDIVYNHLERLVTGKVDIRDLEIIQKLGFDYKSPTFPLKIFSDHLKEIGKPARPNDRLAFIVGIKPNSLAGDDPKLGHYYRLTETIKEEMNMGTNDIDYMYYIDRLTNDVDQIFSVGYRLEIEKENEVRLNAEKSELQNLIDEICLEIAPHEKDLETLPEDTPKQRKEKKSLMRIVKNKKLEIEKLKKKIVVLDEAKGGVDKAIQKIKGKNAETNLRLTENMYSSLAEIFRARLSNKK